MSIETHTNNSAVLIVYDSVRSGKRAKELFDRLGQHFELNLSVWSLSALRLPALAWAAAHEAERAILLIVAVNGDETLPRHVKTCLRRCARAIHAGDGALVAQFHSILKTNDGLCPAYGCLKQIAHHAGVRFFSERVELPEDELDCSSDRSAARGGTSGTWPVSETRCAPDPKPILKRFFNRSLTKPKINFQ
ncbi:MAG: hypothetical protein ACREIC_08470 [Limisphaerales bacterium]